MLHCGREEDEGHSNGNGCFETAKVLVCVETELHVHDESCCVDSGAITCIYSQWEDHVHTAECYETRYMLTCGESEGEDSSDPASPSNAEAVREAEIEGTKLHQAMLRRQPVGTKGKTMAHIIMDRSVMSLFWCWHAGSTARQRTLLMPDGERHFRPRSAEIGLKT